MSRETPVLAALATIPTRARFLRCVLGSLRPQVDRLFVYLNGHTEVPDAVRELADEWILDEKNGGAEKKLHWASTFDEGHYFSADDDIVYPKDYVARMSAAIDRWDGRAIVSAHGRVYRPGATHADAVSNIGIFHKRVEGDCWVNHCGSGVMAWDARVVRMPSEWPLRNIVDMQVALWAQREGVPMWRIGHATNWIGGLAIVDPDGIFKTSQRDGNHRRRSELVAAHSKERGWSVHQVSP